MKRSPLPPEKPDTPDLGQCHAITLAPTHHTGVSLTKKVHFLSTKNLKVGKNTIGRKVGITSMLVNGFKKNWFYFVAKSLPYMVSGQNFPTHYLSGQD